MMSHATTADKIRPSEVMKGMDCRWYCVYWGVAPERKQCLQMTWYTENH